MDGVTEWRKCSKCGTAFVTATGSKKQLCDSCYRELFEQNASVNVGAAAPQTVYTQEVNAAPAAVIKPATKKVTVLSGSENINGETVSETVLKEYVGPDGKKHKIVSRKVLVNKPFEQPRPVQRPFEQPKPSIPNYSQPAYRQPDTVQPIILPIVQQPVAAPQPLPAQDFAVPSDVQFDRDDASFVPSDLDHDGFFDFSYDVTDRKLFRLKINKTAVVKMQAHFKVADTQIKIWVEKNRITLFTSTDCKLELEMPVSVNKKISSEKISEKTLISVKAKKQTVINLL